MRTACDTDDIFTLSPKDVTTSSLSNSKEHGDSQRSTPVATPINTPTEYLTSTVSNFSRSILGHWQGATENEIAFTDRRIEESVEFFTVEEDWENVDVQPQQPQAPMWVVNGALVEVDVTEKDSETSRSMQRIKSRKMFPKNSRRNPKKGIIGWFQKRKEKQRKRRERFPEDGTEATAASIASSENMEFSLQATTCYNNISDLKSKIHLQQLEVIAKREAYRDETEIFRDQCIPRRDALTKNNVRGVQEQEIVINNSVHMVLLGSENSGKTSVLQRLVHGVELDLLNKPLGCSRLGVDFHEWELPLETNKPENKIHFNCLDFAGQRQELSEPHEIFFSNPHSVYVLTWDMGAHDQKTYTDFNAGKEFSSRSNEPRHVADRELERNFDANVQYWIDRIGKNVQKRSHEKKQATIIPVLTFKDSLQGWDVERRKNLLVSKLKSRNRSKDDIVSILPEHICILSSVTCEGITSLKQTISKIATDARVTVSSPLFGSVISEHTNRVKKVVDELKAKRVDYIYFADLWREVKASLRSDCVLTESHMEEALNFLENIGEINCFPHRQNGKSVTVENQKETEYGVESQVILLNPKWIVNAFSCIVEEKNETVSRISTEKTQSLNTNCPLRYYADLTKIWNSNHSMLEALRKSRSKRSVDEKGNFDFILNLMEDLGLVVKLNKGGNVDSSIYFLPSHLTDDRKERWSYKTREKKVILAQSYTTNTNQKLSNASASLRMNDVMTQLLQDLYASFPFMAMNSVEEASSHLHDHGLDQPHAQSSCHQSCIQPFNGVEQPCTPKSIRIRDVLCWKSAMLIKFCYQFLDPDTDLSTPVIIEVFVELEQPYSSSRKSWHPKQRRLILSARGSEAYFGKLIWSGGYELVQDSVEKYLKKEFRECYRKDIFCPLCLSKVRMAKSSSWSDKYISDEVNMRSKDVICRECHRVDLKYLSNACHKANYDVNDYGNHDRLVSFSQPVVRSEDLFEGVVLVALCDKKKQIRRVGSGFVVDKKRGLLLTAAHTVLNMGDEKEVPLGADYYDIPSGDIVIGMIPRCTCKKNDFLANKCAHCSQGAMKAMFTYFADITEKDIANDACVLKIRTKLQNPVTGLDIDGSRICEQVESFPVLKNNKPAIKKERMKELKLTTVFEYDESLRVVGYGQCGHGMWRPGERINRCPMVDRGHLCSPVEYDHIEDNKQHTDWRGGNLNSGSGFQPTKELCVSCRSISGQSGGPVVNQKGEVVGFLCRGFADRSYLIPSSSLVKLVEDAKRSKRSKKM